jgi:1-hydroxy-2-methyl-2-(E)-butenyl 4-diphosphate synthase
LIAERSTAVAVGHEQAAIAQAQKMRRQAPDADGMRLAPRFPAVGRFRLQRLAGIGFRVIANVDQEAAIGRFDGVKLVVFIRIVTGARRDFGQPAPRLPVVARLGDAVAAGASPKLLAGIEEASVAKLDGAMRAVHDGRDARRPRPPAIGGANEPLAEFGLAVGVTEARVRCFPAGDFFRRPGWVGELAFQGRLVGERGERGDKQRALRGFEHTGVAIVGGAVEQHARIRPRLALVARRHRDDLAKRTDVRLASARARDPQLAVRAPRHRGPAMVVLRLLADDARIENLDLRRRGARGSEAHGGEPRGGGEAVTEELAASGGSMGVIENVQRPTLNIEHSRLRLPALFLLVDFPPSIGILEGMLHCASPYHRHRRLSRVVQVGRVAIGGSHPIRVQSMITCDTMDTAASIAQTIELAEVGCEIVRITAPTVKDAANLQHIVAGLRERGCEVPIVADIHFKPDAAMEAAKWVEKVRVNPGNFADSKKFNVREYTDAEYAAELERIRERFAPLVRFCKEHGRAMRIGTNHGSLSDRIMNRYGDTPLGMVESALEFARIARELDYHEFVFSMKSSNPKVMIEAYRLLTARLGELEAEVRNQKFNGRAPGSDALTPDSWQYPLHLGVTEAGDGEDGRIKSAIGIGSLLMDGIGDTIRVSLTEDSIHEIPVARALVELVEKESSEARAGDKAWDQTPISLRPIQLRAAGDGATRGRRRSARRRGARARRDSAGDARAARPQAGSAGRLPTGNRGAAGRGLCGDRSARRLSGGGVENECRTAARDRRRMASTSR